MNSIEEKLWSFIDGTCTAEESAQIARLILVDDEYKRQYDELLALHAEFATIELDEPPMAFTYHVMEQIRTQEALVPLKATINKRYVYGVAGFFGISILALLIFVLCSISWVAGPDTASFTIPVKMHVPNMEPLFTGPWMKGFLFFDTVLALFLLDSYFRKKSSVSQGQSN